MCWEYVCILNVMLHSWRWKVLRFPELHGANNVLHILLPMCYFWQILLVFCKYGMDFFDPMFSYQNKGNQIVVRNIVFPDSLQGAPFGKSGEASCEYGLDPFERRFVSPKAMQLHTSYPTTIVVSYGFRIFQHFPWFQKPSPLRHTYATDDMLVKKNTQVPESTQEDTGGHPWVPRIVNLHMIRCVCCILNVMLHAWWSNVLKSFELH